MIQNTKTLFKFGLVIYTNNISYNAIYKYNNVIFLYKENLSTYEQIHDLIKNILQKLCAT